MFVTGMTYIHVILGLDPRIHVLCALFINAVRQ